MSKGNHTNNCTDFNSFNDFITLFLKHKTKYLKSNRGFIISRSHFFDTQQTVAFHHIENRRDNLS